jgi:hypothetical protein
VETDGTYTPSPPTSSRCSGEDRGEVGKRRGEAHTQEQISQVPDPGCTYGLIVGRVLAELQHDLSDIQDQLQWLARLLVGALVSAAVAILLDLLTS